ncbi:MAG: chemotaxis protein CheR, partial [Myxococcales bacterium]|nr:chemotaxis protein CheR [Myxococcales bacterium]
DVIFCRNVLIYFEPPVRDAVVTHLVQALAPGGTLYVGHSESLPNKFGLRQLGTSTWMRPGGPS